MSGLNNIWAAGLAEMGLLSSFNRSVKYLLYIVHVLTNYPWFKPLKDKKAKPVLHGIVEIAEESRRKPNNYGLIKKVSFVIILCKND